MSRATDGVRRRGQGRRRREGEGSCSRPRARPYETIEPVAESFGDLDPEIDARDNDVAKGDAVDRLPPHREGALGRRTRPRAWRRSPTSCSPTSSSCEPRSQDLELPAGAARQRRGRAAGRGLAVEDHRRGGALLAHRPARLRGQRRRRPRGLRPARARRCRTPTPSSPPRSTQRFADVYAALTPLPGRGRRLRALRRTSTEQQRQELSQAVDALAEPLVGGGRPESSRNELMRPPIARRDHAAGACSGAGAAGGLALGGGRAGFAIGKARRRDATRPPRSVVPFYGEHQAGIATPAQDRLHFASFDLTDATASPTCGRCCRTGRRPRRG